MHVDDELPCVRLERALAEERQHWQELHLANIEYCARIAALEAELRLANEHIAVANKRIARAEQERDAARADAERLDWCLPLLTGEDSPEIDRRTEAIAHALIVGLDGRAAIDAAMGKPGAGG